MPDKALDVLLQGEKQKLCRIGIVNHNHEKWHSLQSRLGGKGQEPLLCWPNLLELSRWRRPGQIKGL